MIGRPWLMLFTTFTIWCYVVKSGNAYAATRTAGEVPTPFWQSSIAMIGVGLASATLVCLALLLLTRPRTRTVRDRLAPFVGAEERSVPSEDTGSPGNGGPLASLLERVFEDASWWQRLDERVKLAGIEAPTAKIVLQTALATLLATVTFAMIVGSPILAVFGAGTPILVLVLVERRLRGRQADFAEQLADNLQMLASSMRGGQSMAGGLAVVAEEAAEPARGEFRLIVAEERLGVPLDEAIRLVARRMDSRGMDQVALVAAIQRQAGGNTADVLDRVVETIRERIELQRMVKTLTAQGRISRNIVSALPVLLLLTLSVINPAYVRPLLHTTGGQMMLGLGAVLTAIGFWVISRIVNIKV